MFNQLFEGLGSRQKEVLVGRFGLEGQKDPQTLAALGDKYGVTRERVRQIEASGLAFLTKKIKAISACAELFSACQKHLKNGGGVLKQDQLLGALKNSAEGLTDRHMNLLIEATKAFYLYPEDNDFWAFYYLDKNSLKKAADAISQFAKSLRSAKEEVLNGGYDAHLAKFVRQQKTDAKLMQNYLGISKRIYANPYGDTGLAEWPEIKPKTIRDRIYLVLKKKGEPIHFQAIAEHINDAGFGGRKALAPTVHNELIKDKRFVLVGRGMYGLAEHGYEAGTAKEVIYKILKDRGPLEFEQLISAIQKNRIFKPNTILANLQRKDLFLRAPDGTYRIREA